MCGHDFRSTWVRNWLCWRYLRDYFPLNIIKTADLPPNKSYIFATFPHGILSVGAFCAFSTNACNFCSIFPGLNPITVTLKINFLTPFIRDIGYAFGKKIIYSQYHGYSIESNRAQYI